MSFLQSAISPDQRLIAIVPPSSNGRLLVQVYQVASSQLKLTLTHSNATTKTSAASSSHLDLKELVFCGDSTVVARFGTSEIICWDLDRGVVSQTLEARDEEEILGLASYNSSFYTLNKHGTKLVVHEYSNGKLTRKVKSGKWEGEGKVAVSDSYIVVQTASGLLRVMSSENGKKVGKISGTNFSSMRVIGDLLATTQTKGSVVMYSLATCSEESKIPHPISSNVHSTTLLQSSNEHLMVEGTIYDKQSKNVLATFKSDVPIALFLISEDRVLVMIHQKRTGCKSRWFDLDNLDGIIDLDKADNSMQVDGVTSPNTQDKAAKRKSSEPMVLGPGQAGAEVAPPVKKSRVIASGDEESNDDVNEEAKDLTIAERLEQLKNSLNESDAEDDEDDDEMGSPGEPSARSTFKPHHATTESLKELLTQALQANDDTLLGLALGVRDVKVISTTLKEIESAHVVTLMSKLTARLASNPLRAEGLALWLSRCLKQGTFEPRHLAPLRNLLYERTESFADLLRLEGRLALMCDVE